MLGEDEEQGLSGLPSFVFKTGSLNYSAYDLVHSEQCYTCVAVPCISLPDLDQSRGNNEHGVGCTMWPGPPPFIS